EKDTVGAMVGSKAVAVPHRIGNADRCSFLGDGEMEHAARGLLSNEQFPNSFFKRSDPSHPPVNIETLFFGHVASFLVLVLENLAPLSPSWCTSRLDLRSFIRLGETQPFRARGRARARNGRDHHRPFPPAIAALTPTVALYSFS